MAGRGPGNSWAAMVVCALAVAGCGGGTGSDQVGPDAPVPVDVLADLPLEEADAPIARDLPSEDPGLDAPGPDLAGDAAPELPPADLPDNAVPDAPPPDLPDDAVPDAPPADLPDDAAPELPLADLPDDAAPDLPLADLPDDAAPDLPPADLSNPDVEPADDGPGDPAPADPGGSDLIPPDLPGDPGIGPCPRLPAPASRSRKVAVALPYGSQGEKVAAWTLLDLSEDGTLATSGAGFSMGTALSGQVTFTPDGSIGLISQDDGSLGVFRIEEDGSPTVIHAAFKGSFYGSGVVMAPEGDHAFVIDSQWRNIGGGIHRVDIACDGSLTDRGRVVEAKLPRALLVLPGRPDRAVLAAEDALDSVEGRDVHLLRWGTEPAVLGGTLAFATEAIVMGATATPDGRYVLLGDNDEFSGEPNRVAIVSVEGDDLSVPQILSPLEDPVVLLAAPEGGTVLAVSGYGNALFILDRNDSTPATPYSVRGEVAYQGGRPQLPGAAVMVERGPLSGLVLVTEVEGVRSVRLQADGSVDDLGLTSLGDSFLGMPGAIGVQP